MLPDAWDQAEANPARVLGVARELLMERAILKRRAITSKATVIRAGTKAQVDASRSGVESIQLEKPT
jgi:hypothetical protein